MTEIRTQRLVLRAPRLDDAPHYALGVSEYDVARFLTALPWPYTLAMAIDWLRQVPEPTPDRALFVLELPGKGLIGCVSLLNELGFWISRQHWNRGYASEAAAALIDWHYSGTSADIVACSAHHDNAASLSVQRKLGFTLAGKDMRFSHCLQRNVPHVVTTLSRQDWMERRSR